jgi:mRNA interferase MazF
VRRGDVVAVAAAGDYGKPRHAVIVQTDALSAKHASVVVCQMTSDIIDALDFRVTIDADEKTACEHALR